MTLAWYSWLIGFGLTLLFEVPLVLWLLRPVEPSWRRRLAVALCANFLTHPLVWFFFPQLPIDYPARLALSELWAFGAETLFYWGFVSKATWIRALITSVVANGTSFGLGWLVVTRFSRWLF